MVIDWPCERRKQAKLEKQSIGESRGGGLRENIRNTENNVQLYLK